MRARYTLLAGALSLSTASACGPAMPADLPLPDKFLLGVATAGFQNEPGCPTIPASECTDSHSDWYDFVTSPDIIKDPATFVTGEPLDHASGSYELYPKDFDIVRDGLHGNAVRLSLEWSRLFPQATDAATDYASMKQLADPRAVAHYHQVFAALKAHGLTPLVTLNHYTLPSWIHDAVGCHKDLAHCQRRGWLDSDRTIREIAKYASFAGKEYGAEVDLWATLNEPFAVVIPGYLLPTADRSNPPAVSLAFDSVRTVMVAMITGHARMYDAVHQADTVDADGDGKAARVGLVYNMTPAAPRDPQSDVDVQGAKNLFYLYNTIFLNGAIKGDLDAKMDGTTVHRDDLAGRMDFLGINYYTRIIVDGTPAPTLGGLSPLSTFNPLTLTIYTEYPQGIADMVNMANQQYGVPAIITENGSSDQTDDSVAPRYLVEHMTSLATAIGQGARVEGYFYWTLVDNYEWNHGMSMHFGLYKLESDKTRTPRPVADAYQQIAAAHAVPAALLAKYPLPQ